MVMLKGGAQCLQGRSMARKGRGFHIQGRASPVAKQRSPIYCPGDRPWWGKGVELQPISQLQGHKECCSILHVWLLLTSPRQFHFTHVPVPMAACVAQSLQECV